MSTPSSWHLYYAPVQKILLPRPSFQASLMFSLPSTLSILKEELISFNLLLWNTNVKVGVQPWINLRLTLRRQSDGEAEVALADAGLHKIPGGHHTGKNYCLKGNYIGKHQLERRAPYFLTSSCQFMLPALFWHPSSITGAGGKEPAMLSMGSLLLREPGTEGQLSLHCGYKNPEQCKGQK